MDRPTHTATKEHNMPAGLEEDHLLTPAEVATMFAVDPKTVTRWAQAGRITSVRTLGGHRRYNSAEVTRLLNESRTEKITEEN